MTIARPLLRIASVVAGLCTLLPALRAATFPKPAPERQFAELKIYDADGRPWRSAREDWAGARARIAADPAWQTWLERERATVDAWMARHRDRVEWAAGWSHDGVSPKDGSRVTWTEQIPREEVAHFSSPSDPRIDITDKLHAWWVVQFRGRHVDTLVRAARLFRLTGETRYADWVSGQMDFYADNFLKWIPGRPEQGARLFWQTLTESTNLVKFTDAVRLLGDFPGAARRTAWRDKFFLPEVAVLNANFQTIHNIATWQRCAVAQVALLFGDDALWRDALGSRYGLRRQLAEGITSDYLWHEQSLGYNAYVVQAVLTLATAAGLHGRAAELADELAVAQNLMLAPIVLRFPTGHLPNPADSGSIGRAPNRELLASAYRVFPTPLGLADAAGRREWDTLLDPPPPAAAAMPPSLPEVESRSLESTRMAVLRRGDWQVFFHYGQLTRSHAQAEVLNYSAFWRDTDVTHDPGTVGYGSPLYRGYYAQGANHNLPLVDGAGPEGFPLAGELVGFSAADATVTAAQPSYRKDVRARRTLTIRDGALVDTATIESTGRDTPRRLGLALHLQSAPPILAGATPVGDLATFARGRPAPFGYWRHVQQATGRDRLSFVADYPGGVKLRVTIAAPGAFTVWLGDTPDVPPARRPSLYLELAESAASATFTTTFEPVAP